MLLFSYGINSVAITPAIAREMVDIYFGLLANSTSITEGSAKVEVSPRSLSSIAILRRILRMIFPDRVFGNPGALWKVSGAANAPILSRTKLRRSCFKLSSKRAFRAKVTKQYKDSPLIGCGFETTAASKIYNYT